MCVVMFVVVATIVGPLATAGLPTSDRFVYWCACSLLALPAFHCTNIAALYLLRYSCPLKLGLGLVAVCSTFYCGAVGTAIVLTADAVFRPDYEQVKPLRLFQIVTFMMAIGNAFFFFLVYQRLSHPTPHVVIDEIVRAYEKQRRRGTIDEMPLPTQTPLPTALADPDGNVDGTEQTGSDVPRGVAATRGEPPTGGHREADEPERRLGDGETHEIVFDGMPSPASGRRVPQEHGAAAGETTPDRFLDRLPVRIGRDLVFLKVDDHYLDIYTVAGHAMLLMRMTDAVGELKSIGLQVHRSFWVARAHIKDLVKIGNRHYVRLTGDHRVPASRTYLPEVRAAIRESDLIGAQRTEHSR